MAWSQNVGTTKLAVLEEKLNMYEDLSREMLAKLESAVEKISEGNNRIATILAKHDERIEQSIKTDELILKMIEDVKDINSKQNLIINKRIEVLELKTADLDKTRWMTVGIAIFSTLLVTVFSSLLSGIFVPNEVPSRNNFNNHNHSLTEKNK